MKIIILYIIISLLCKRTISLNNSTTTNGTAVKISSVAPYTNPFNVTLPNYVLF